MLTHPDPHTLRPCAKVTAQTTEEFPCSGLRALLKAGEQHQASCVPRLWDPSHSWRRGGTNDPFKAPKENTSAAKRSKHTLYF